MVKIHESSQGAGRLEHHEQWCGRFQVKGKIRKGEVLGVCSKCRKVLEKHGRRGVRNYEVEE